MLRCICVMAAILSYQSGAAFADAMEPWKLDAFRKLCARYAGSAPASKLDPGRGRSCRRRFLQKGAIRHLDALAGVGGPVQINTHGPRHFCPTSEMNRLTIEKNTIEIKQNGLEFLHSGELAISH